tara:strand:- start:3113 stop:3328 length:216 start_codon:yes stop_codon:yes gene_type:complete
MNAELNLIWQTFLGYHSMIGQEGREAGLDLFGTEQVSNMAIQLTVAHFLNEISTELKSSNKISLRSERSKG